MPSQSFTEREKELEADAAKTAQAKLDAKEKIYFAPAKKFQIANFVTEIRNQGRIDRTEEPLIFQDNLYVTPDKKKQDFIESSNPFLNGQVKLCKDMAEAVAMRHARNAAKQSHREVESTSITEVKG